MGKESLRRKNDIEWVDIKYHMGSYSKGDLTDYSCIINEINVESKKHGLLDTKQFKLGGVTLKVDEQYDVTELRKIGKKVKEFKVFLTNNTDEDEEDESDEADFLYAMGGHGCSSFDEFIERMNFPEEYE